MNKAIILGNIGKDLEPKVLPSGVAVLNFSVATNRTYKNKDGEKVKETEWHNVVAFGKTAEIISQYFSKGKQILVEGRIQTKSWEQDGVTKYKTEILLSEFSFVNGGEATEKPLAQTKQQAPELYPDDNADPNDIPFASNPVQNADDFGGF